MALLVAPAMYSHLRKSFDAVQDSPVAVRIVVAAVLVLGVLRLVSALSSVLQAFYRHFVRGGKNLKKYGQWGVVTGATDGIGKAQALELAKKGLNVVLISRTQSKLDATAKEITAATGGNVQVNVLAVDFANPDFEKIRRALNDLDIGVLINNVGVSYPFPQYLNEFDDKLIDDMLRLNVSAATFMSKLVVGGMVKRKRGAIVNIGSASGAIQVGAPLLSVYSGTKAYLDFFSRSLDAELRGKGVHVQCQVPLFVTSKLSKIRRSSLFTPKPSTFAKASIKAIGYESVSVPYWPHALQLTLVNSLPTFASKGYIGSLHRSLRKRAMRKLKQQQ